MYRKIGWVSLLSATVAFTMPVAATPFFSTGDPDGRIGTASRPSSSGKLEIESADDFILNSQTAINSATFTGLLTGGAPSIDKVVVEIYRVFPNASDVNRTSGPPTFSTPQVPTRVNSPSDVAVDSRDSTTVGDLTFTTTNLGSFNASNSILNGIHPKPNQTTGGDGAISGTEFQFDVTFTTPFSLVADHYFFVPQVQVAGGEFYWLSAPKPITGGTGPFTPDLQSWIRDENLDPDWLRIGTDIIGGSSPPTFNAAFSLTGQSVPEPGTLALLGIGTLALLGRRRKPAELGSRVRWRWPNTCQF